MDRLWTPECTDIHLCKHELPIQCTIADSYCRFQSVYRPHFSHPMEIPRWCLAGHKGDKSPSTRPQSPHRCPPTTLLQKLRYHLRWPSPPPPASPTPLVSLQEGTDPCLSSGSAPCNHPFFSGWWLHCVAGNLQYIPSPHSPSCTASPDPQP